MGISMTRDENEASTHGYWYNGFYLDKDNDICHVTRVTLGNEVRYSIVWIRAEHSWSGTDDGSADGYIDTLRPCPAFTLRYTP